MIYHKNIIENGYLLKLEIKLIPMPAIIQDGDLTLEDGAYMVQNMGEHAAILEDSWTILPGGNNSYGASNDINVINCTLSVRFDSNVATDPGAPYPGNRLEIMRVATRVCSCEPCKNLI